MHCDEVIRELAVPTDDRDSAAVSEHLASCPSCAGWADACRQLDRLWDATRPTEPSPEVWDTVWAQVASSLDSVDAGRGCGVLASRDDSNGSAIDDRDACRAESVVGPRSRRGTGRRSVSSGLPRLPLSCSRWD